MAPKARSLNREQRLQAHVFSLWHEARRLTPYAGPGAIGHIASQLAGVCATVASSLQAHQHATHLLEVVHILVKLVGSDSYQANPAAQVEKLQAMLHAPLLDEVAAMVLALMPSSTAGAPSWEQVVIIAREPLQPHPAQPQPASASSQLQAPAESRVTVAAAVARLLEMALAVCQGLAAAVADVEKAQEGTISSTSTATTATPTSASGPSPSPSCPDPQLPLHQALAAQLLHPCCGGGSNGHRHGGAVGTQGRGALDSSPMYKVLHHLARVCLTCSAHSSGQAPITNSDAGCLEEELACCQGPSQASRTHTAIVTLVSGCAMAAAPGLFTADMPHLADLVLDLTEPWLHAMSDIRETNDRGCLARDKDELLKHACWWWCNHLAHLADLKQGRSTGDDVGMEQLNRQAWLGRLLLACLLNLVDVLTNELATFMSSCWESISPMGPKADPGLHSLTLALALLHDVLVPTYQGSWSEVSCEGLDRGVGALSGITGALPSMPGVFERYMHTLPASHPPIRNQHHSTPQQRPTITLHPYVTSMYSAMVLLPVSCGNKHNDGTRDQRLSLLPQLLQTAERQLAWARGVGGDSSTLFGSASGGVNSPLCSPATVTATLAAAYSYITSQIRQRSSAVELAGLSAPQLRLLVTLVRLHNAVVLRAAGVGVGSAQEREEWCAAMVRYNMTYTWATICKALINGIKGPDELPSSVQALCCDLILAICPGHAIPMAASLCMRMERMMQRQGLHGQGKRMKRHVAPRLQKEQATVVNTAACGASLLSGLWSLLKCKHLVSRDISLVQAWACALEESYSCDQARVPTFTGPSVALHMAVSADVVVKGIQVLATLAQSQPQGLPTGTQVRPCPDRVMGHALGAMVFIAKHLHTEHLRLRQERTGGLEGKFTNGSESAWLEEQLAGVLREGVPGPGVRPQQALAVAREAWAIAKVCEYQDVSFLEPAAKAHAEALAAAAGRGGGAGKGPGASGASLPTPATLPTNPIERASRISSSHLVRALLAWYRRTCHHLLSQIQAEVALGMQVLQGQVGRARGEAGSVQNDGRGDRRPISPLREQAIDLAAAESGSGTAGDAEPASGDKAAACPGDAGLGKTGMGEARARSGWAALSLEQRLVVAESQLAFCSSPRNAPASQASTTGATRAIGGTASTVGASSHPSPGSALIQNVINQSLAFIRRVAQGEEVVFGTLEMGLPERQAERALTTLSGIGFASPTAVDISVGDMFRTFTDERYQATVDAVEDALTKQQLVWCARNLQAGSGALAVKVLLESFTRQADVDELADHFLLHAPELMGL